MSFFFFFFGFMPSCVFLPWPTNHSTSQTDPIRARPPIHVLRKMEAKKKFLIKDSRMARHERYSRNYYYIKQLKCKHVQRETKRNAIVNSSEHSKEGAKAEENDAC